MTIRLRRMGHLVVEMLSAGNIRGAWRTFWREVERERARLHEEAVWAKIEAEIERIEAEKRAAEKPPKEWN